ncbi:uncharacterized protein PHACADRAFT_184652 [Phanerochaete carnosa HHB-10118-sp]|uniref:Survival protein SurE-like phosphatase/nucleotidase domain-containing protein n=1 Tax=Phanerochaete carnosa (strain HHB-10118-sp) TaxID=650164 RepID=K5V0D1_PHACS|nr:uncharacterized protein PHACADRAFT_184652 [Phanerochaete carnosa HHB-10118-sp]EKM55916.1 hypothetical protein PHACADRAFT_184652 [Phanerochaete carnosa HHB-10118-sp]
MLSSFTPLCALFFVGINVASVAFGANTSLNIILTNDDNWASANIRATYSALTAAGHNVILSAPVVQNSGQGGRFILPTTNITIPDEFGILQAGAPYYGQDPNNNRIWYMNGTPAAAVSTLYSVIRPIILGDNSSIDLVVAGPNEGHNLGGFYYTLSGTMGATVDAIYRERSSTCADAAGQLPAIAVSAGNGTHHSYLTLTNDTNDPANLAARLTTSFVNALASTKMSGQPLLPLGTGASINLPMFGRGLIAQMCERGAAAVHPHAPNRRRRRAGARHRLKRLPQRDTNRSGRPLTHCSLSATDGVNVNYTGSRILPGETGVTAGRQSSVSFFSID